MSMTPFIGVPVKHQETYFSCGPAVLLSLLRFYGIYIHDESCLYSLLKTDTEQGTKASEMVRVAHQFGLKTQVFEPMSIAQLEMFVHHQLPVVIEVQNRNRSHFVIVVGMTNSHMILMDPAYKKTVQKKRLYRRVLWRNYLKDWHSKEGKKTCKQLGIVMWM